MEDHLACIISNLTPMCQIKQSLDNSYNDIQINVYDMSGFLFISYESSLEKGWIIQQEFGSRNLEQQVNIFTS